MPNILVGTSSTDWGCYELDPETHQLLVEDVGRLGVRWCILAQLIAAEPKNGCVLTAPDGASWRVTGASMPTPLSLEQRKRLYLVEGDGPGMPAPGTYLFFTAV